MKTIPQWLALSLCCAITPALVPHAAAQAPNSLLDGEYVTVLHLGYGPRTEADFSAECILMSFDGNGNGTFEVVHSSAGNSDSVGFTYSVKNDATFSLTISVYGWNSVQLHGVVSSDGENFVMWPFSIGIRRSSGMSNASLSGEYVTTGYLTNKAGVPGGEYCTMNLNGDGSGVLQIHQCSTGDTGSYPCTYTVNDDGTFDMTVTGVGNGSMNLQGIVRSDGESYTMVCTDTSAYGIYGGLKKSSGMSNASLSGEFAVIHYITEENSSTEYSLVNFSGDGSGTSEILYSSSGDAGSTWSCTYAVNDDGTFSMASGDGGDSVTIPGVVGSDRKNLLAVGPGSPECGIFVGLAISDTPVGIQESTREFPTEYALGQNYPNPFNPSTNISYQLPVASDVGLVVFDVLGRKVETLVNGFQPPGYKLVEWNAGGVASGVYFYRLHALPTGSGQAGNFIQTKKFILLR